MSARAAANAPENTQLQTSEPNAPDSPDPLHAGSVVSRYVVLTRIGKGGMGVVYSAYDPQLDRKVAMKILRPDVATSKRGSARAGAERSPARFAVNAPSHPVLVFFEKRARHL